MNEINDFFEFIGCICFVFCEKSCVLKLSMDFFVIICENEVVIVEVVFCEGYIKFRNIECNGWKVVIIGVGFVGLVVVN